MSLVKRKIEYEFTGRTSTSHETKMRLLLFDDGSITVTGGFSGDWRVNIESALCRRLQSIEKRIDEDKKECKTITKILKKIDNDRNRGEKT